MKKYKLLVISLLVALLAGCNEEKENTKPIIEGVNGMECVVNSSVDLLNGVIAYDNEEGDITPKMNIDIYPSISVNNGYAIFKEKGSYKVTYSVKDKEGLETIKRTDINVADREIFYSFAKASGLYTTSSSKVVLNNAGMKNGSYLISATNAEVYEDIAVHRVFAIKENTNYSFRYLLDSKSNGRVRVLVDNELLHEQKIVEGENLVYFTYQSTFKTSITLSLLLGELGEEINCQIKSIEYDFPQVEGLVNILNSYATEGRFDGAEGNAYTVNEDDVVKSKLEITTPYEKVSEDDNGVWRGGMFINTYIETKADKEYIVSFDLERLDPTKECEIAIQKDKFNEYKYETVFVNSTDKVTTHQVTFTPNNDNKGSLFLYVQSGENINTITLSNLSVKTYLDPVATQPVEISDFYASNEGYECTLETFNGGFNYFVESFGNIDYHQKVTSPKFYLEGSGSNYVVSFTAKADKPIECVFAAPISDGWDPTWVWAKFTITEEERVYTFKGNDAIGVGGNILVWQFGSTNNQRFTNVNIEISNVNIYYKNSEYDGE